MMCRFLLRLYIHIDLHCAFEEPSLIGSNMLLPWTTNHQVKLSEAIRSKFLLEDIVSNLYFML